MSAHNSVLAPKTLPKKARTRARRPKTDNRIIVRLPTDHPLRFQDTLLVPPRLRGLPKRLEPIKDIRNVPSGISLVVSSASQAQELLQAAQSLQPITGNAQIERQEKKLNYLLGPLPNFGYNATGVCEPLTEEGIR